MQFSWKRAARIAALTAAAAAGLAAPNAAGAQLFVNNPEFKTGPIEGSDPLVGLPIAGATPAEYRAHLLWNLRAGLNVAALQCQFSPYLRAVDNYNGILAHHAEELAGAYTALNGYFKRTQGAKGQKAFDDYTTITYNNFSTLQAQYGFCQTASSIAKEALTRPKGQFYVTAQNRMRELRSSLVPAYDRGLTYNPYQIKMPAMPELREECFDKKNRLRKRCGGTA
ncbi:MAG TPA: hypothetical protein VF662_04570 [Allosphingosinicella sp.]